MIYFKTFDKIFASQSDLVTDELTIVLLLATLVNTKWCENAGKSLKPWQMGTHLAVFIQSFPMHINMAGFEKVFKFF